MKNTNDYGKEGNIDDIVETIIKLPAKNLEERIRTIRKDIKARQTILDSSLSILRMREIEIESKLSIMKYSQGNELNRKLSLENELTKIRNTKINNKISHFQDNQRLKEKLQTAKEQLAIEREKRKLIE